MAPTDIVIAEAMSQQQSNNNYGSDFESSGILTSTQTESIPSRGDYDTDSEFEAALLSLAQHLPKPPAAPSDYGSDFDTDGEEAVGELLAQLEGVSVKPLVLENIIEDVSSRCHAHVPLFSSQASHKSATEDQMDSGGSAQMERDAGGELQPPVSGIGRVTFGLLNSS